MLSRRSLVVPGRLRARVERLRSTDVYAATLLAVAGYGLAVATAWTSVTSPPWLASGAALALGVVSLSTSRLVRGRWCRMSGDVFATTAAAFGFLATYVNGIGAFGALLARLGLRSMGGLVVFTILVFVIEITIAGIATALQPR